MTLEDLIAGSRPFLTWLVDWYNSRPVLPLDELLNGAPHPADRIAVLAVDVTEGFCSDGALASPRVGRIIKPVARLFRRAHQAGVRHFLLPQDTHTEDAVEFGSFPPHCVGGSAESVTVAELRDLSFSGLYQVMEKNSIRSDIDTELDAWLADHPEVTTFIVVGDVTDICVYQLALHLRARANARSLRDTRVIVPVDGVDTFDIPVDVAQQIGAMPHPGDLIHLIFLYSMAQNGVEIVAEVS
jgi:nicotinamidase-related amidase